MISFYKNIVNARISLQNLFLPEETIEESKIKWTNFARQDPNFFVVTNRDICNNKEKYRESGKKVYEKYVKEDIILKEYLKNYNVALDIGCGTGRVTEFFGNDFDKVYGTDIASGMIEKAKENLKEEKFCFLETDGAHIPLQNNLVDFAFSIATFQHIPNKITIESNFLDVFRILKSQGLFKVQLRSSPIIKKSWSYGVWFNKKSAEKLAKKCGFQIIYIFKETDRNLWLLLRK